MSVLLLMLALFLALAACKTPEEPEESIDPVPPDVSTLRPERPTPTPEPSPEPTPVRYRHPLTGEPLEEEFNNRMPYAMMINNIVFAQPHCGVSHADIIYEVLAEGGVTRMMAIFTDLDFDEPIGSIRSIRAYYVDIGVSYDAILVHAGGSPQSYPRMKELGVERNIDGVLTDSIPFARDPNRMAHGIEHSLFTTGTKMANFLDTLDIRREHESGFDYNLRFTEDATPERGKDAETITAVFNSGKSTTLTYHEDTGLYTAFQFGGDYIDGNTKEAVTFKNVLVLYADTKVFDNYGRIDVDLIGEGPGQFACGGQYVDIIWSRADGNSPFTYRLASGGALELGVGTSYIAIVPTEATVTFS